MSASALSAHKLALNSLQHLEKIIMATGMINGNLVTIYGEVHSDIDNKFYKQLSLTDQTVFVEHSTLLCELKPHEHALFKNAKGSEWIWYTRTKSDIPVTCIDTRLEQGFLNSMEEAQMRSLNYADPMLGAYVLRVLKAANKIKAEFEPIIDVYKDLNEAIKRQYKIILIACKTEAIIMSNSKQSASISNRTLTVNKQTIPMDYLLQNIKNLLVTNLIKFASLSVDMHVIKTLKSSTTPSSCFMGINHALRIATICDLDIITVRNDLDNFSKNAYMFAEGTAEIELDLLEQFRNSPSK